MTVAVVIDVLKQFRTGQITASLQYLREFAIANDTPMAYAAFGAKIEFDLATLDSHVLISKCREAKAVVLPGILGIADPRKSLFHQPHDGCKNFFTRQIGSRQIGVNPPPDCR